MQEGTPPKQGDLASMLHVSDTLVPLCTVHYEYIIIFHCGPAPKNETQLSFQF